MKIVRLPRVKTRAKTLPASTHYHWPRRLFHAVSGILVVIASFFFDDKRHFAFVLLAGTFLELVVEALRLRLPSFQRFIQSWMGVLMRDGEERRLSGIPYYAFGCTLCFILFPRPIAILAVLYLALGDPAASIAGIFARRGEMISEVRARKSWQGSAACVFVCGVLTFFIFPWLFPQDIHVGSALLFAFVGGLSAGLAELLPFRTDDNLSLPMVSGSLLWLFASLTGLVPGLVS